MFINRAELHLLKRKLIFTEMNLSKRNSYYINEKSEIT